jgi:phage-related tail protein
MEDTVTKKQNLKIIGWTLASVAALVLFVGAISYVSIGARDDYLAGQKIIYDQAASDIQAKQKPAIPERILRVETGATVMTKVWFSRDMKDPIIIQMLVTSGVCKTSKEANEQAMAQIKKPASAIHITCKKISELNQ